MITVFWNKDRPFPFVLHVKRGAEIRCYVPERTATIEASHGAHGPVPRFPGDAWTMHYVCSECRGAVSRGDRYCKHCGARMVTGDDGD